MWGYQSQFDSLDWLDVSTTVKLINPSNPDAWAAVVRASRERGVVVVYRKHWEPGDQPLGDNTAERKAIAEDRASQVVRGIDALGERPVHLLAEGYNETGLWEQADAYSEWTAFFAEALGREGVAHLCYNFATSNPPGYRNQLPGETIEEWAEAALKPYWAHYLPGLETTMNLGGALGLHEYLKELTGQYVPWHFGRHRHVVQVLPERLKRVPIYITEFGADWQLEGLNTGFKDYLSEEAYADLIGQCDAYLRESRRLGCNIKGVHIFGLGMADGWSTFDVKGSPIIRQKIYDLNRKETPVVAVEARVEPGNPAEGSQAEVVAKVTADGIPKMGAIVSAMVRFTDVGIIPDQTLMGNTGSDGVARLSFVVKAQDPIPVGTVVPVEVYATAYDNGEPITVETKTSFTVGGQHVPEYDPQIVMDYWMQQPWLPAEGYNEDDAFGAFLAQYDPRLGAQKCPDLTLGGYLFRFYATGILYAKVGDWANVKVTYGIRGLPPKA